MDRIELNGMEFYGYHGCLPEEREQGQPFFVDVILETELRRAGRTDALEDTINYAEVFEEIRRIVEGKPMNLIEALAERIAETVLGKYAAIERIHVAVHKPFAPISGKFREMTVRIERARA